MLTRCPNCKRWTDPVPVHGHEQCTRCGTNIRPCCDVERQQQPLGPRTGDRSALLRYMQERRGDR